MYIIEKKKYCNQLLKMVIAVYMAGLLHLLFIVYLTALSMKLHLMAQTLHSPSYKKHVT